MRGGVLGSIHAFPIGAWGGVGAVRPSAGRRRPRRRRMTRGSWPRTSIPRCNPWPTGSRTGSAPTDKPRLHPHPVGAPPSARSVGRQAIRLRQRRFADLGPLLRSGAKAPPASGRSAALGAIRWAPSDPLEAMSVRGLRSAPTVRPRLYIVPRQHTRVSGNAAVPTFHPDPSPTPAPAPAPPPPPGGARRRPRRRAAPCGWPSPRRSTPGRTACPPPP